MKKCLVIGNCQQYPLKVLLQSALEFNNQYEIIDDLGPIHTWSVEQIRSVEDKYNDADVILTQPIYDDKYGYAKTSNLMALNEERKKLPIIVFPNIDFLAFFPFSIRVLVDLENDNVPDAQCGIVFLCYINDFNVKRAIEYCRSFYSNELYADIYQAIYERAISRLESTERTFQNFVNVSNLFRNKYKEVKLTRNRLHPSNFVCSFIANKVLTKLGICETVIAPTMEFWAHDEMPITAAIRQALGITFIENDGYFYTKGILKRLEDYIYHLYCYYRGHRRVVEESININERKLETMINIMNQKYANVDIESLFRW